MMGVSLEQFTAAVARLGELRECGLVRVRPAPGNNGLVLAIDKAADDLPAKGGGLYADIMDVMSAIARGTSVEQFVRDRAVPGPDFDEGEDEAVARAKYEATVAAFPPRWLKGGLLKLARRRLREWMTALVLKAARRSGRLRGLMTWYPFARVLGPDGRRTAWRMLGAQIADTAWIGPRVTMQVPREVSVGAGSKLGGRVRVEAYGKVTIGRNVLINDTDLFSTQHDIDDPGLRGERRTISIGDYAWLPHKIIVLPGVRIGSHAVIGSGSVVSRDVSDYGVAVGNPARVVKERARVKYTYVPAVGNRPSLIE